MNAPCKDCMERYVGCHSKCEKYIAYKEERILISRSKRTDQAIKDHFIKEVEKYKKLWKR